MKITKAILITILYLIFVELVSVWIFLADALEVENWEPYYKLTQSLFQATGIIIFLYFCKDSKPSRIKERTHFKWYLFAIILGASFIFIQSPLNSFYNLILGEDYHIKYDFNGLFQSWKLSFVTTILVSPLVEELFFRNYIQRGLHKKYKPIVAILIASALFAAIHGPWISFFHPEWVDNWHQSYITLFGGLISGFLFYKSKVIGPSILFHIIWNLFVILI